MCFEQARVIAHLRAARREILFYNERMHRKPGLSSSFPKMMRLAENKDAGTNAPTDFAGSDYQNQNIYCPRTSLQGNLSYGAQLETE